MHRPAVFCIGAGIFTVAGNVSAGKVDFRAFEFRPSFRGFCSVPAHNVAFPTDRNSFVVDRKIILVNGRASPVSVLINEWGDPMVTAVLIVRHGIMSRV